MGLYKYNIDIQYKRNTMYIIIICGTCHEQNKYYTTLCHGRKTKRYSYYTIGVEY